MAFCLDLRRSFIRALQAKVRHGAQRQGAPSRETVWRRPLSGLSRRFSKFVSFEKPALKFHNERSPNPRHEIKRRRRLWREGPKPMIFWAFWAVCGKLSA